MILFAGNDLKNWIIGRILKLGMGKLRDHAKLCDQAKKKFASAIKLRPVDSCVAMVPGIQEHGMCSAKPSKGISHCEMSRINYKYFYAS